MNATEMAAAQHVLVRAQVHIMHLATSGIENALSSQRRPLRAGISDLGLFMRRITLMSISGASVLPQSAYFRVSAVIARKMFKRTENASLRGANDESLMPISAG
jgi:hypothetical protein